MKKAPYSILAIAVSLTVASCAQKIVPADSAANNGQAAAQYNNNTTGNEVTPQVQSYSKQGASQTGTTTAAPQAPDVKEVRMSK